MMKQVPFLLLLTAFSLNVFAQGKAQNVVVVSLDGFRWQELFGGADETLINNGSFTEDSAALKRKYWASTPEERREKLLPFFWNTLAKGGQVHGNRWKESYANVQNRYWFSYPGYNEIFTGYPDTAVNSNDKNDNRNITVLEYLNRQPAFNGKVAAFTSWDVFDAIFNEKRSGFLVSSGFDQVPVNTSRFALLNEMQKASFKPFGDGVRPDMLTYFLAKEYLKTKKPRVLYIGFDETDDYAHGGKYDKYLNAANLTDTWLADLWKTLQSMPEYKGKTTLIVTCDHGRGDNTKSEWTSHGDKIVGADQIWMAFLGAGISPVGEVSNGPQVYQAQLAQTIAQLLGHTFTANHPVEEAISFSKK
jgi:hypothetical protein